jgi:hypothetical protein
MAKLLAIDHDVELWQRDRKIGAVRNVVGIGVAQAPRI